MSTPATGEVGAWSDTTCLVCGASTGHHDTCPSADPQATDYRTDMLPDGTVRGWAISGVRYTATPARRQAITNLMPTMRWVHIIDRPLLPYSIAVLVNVIVSEPGVGKRLARIGYHPLSTLRVPDCGCTDPWRCRCDFPDHPHHEAHPDLWAEFTLLGLALRWGDGWGHWWLLDDGAGAEFLAEDFTPAPVPTGATKACAMGWCHRCPGSTRPAPGHSVRRACGCPCHTGAAPANPARQPDGLAQPAPVNTAPQARPTPRC